MPAPTVTRQAADAMLNDRRQYVQAIRVEFFIGEDGPFYIKIPQTEYSADRVNQELQKFANEHARIARG